MILEAIKDALLSSDLIEGVFVDDMQGVVRGFFNGKEFVISVDLY